MKNIIFSLVLTTFLFLFLFAQSSLSVNNYFTSFNIDLKELSDTTLTKTGSYPPVEKKDIPKELDTAPSQFFIINDEPVSKEEYMKHIQNKNITIELPK
jgi:hypothetical protein